MISIAKRLLAGLAVVAALSAGPAAAQQAQPSDAKLQSFVTAVASVEQTYKSWQPKIAQAENKQQRSKLSQQAMSEMRSAVADTQGISVEEYQEINGRLRSDKDFRNRVQKIADGMFKEQQAK